MTMDLNRAAQLLVELGERTPSIESIVQEAGAPRWAIELDDGLVVIAELDEERGRLSLETDLGRPPEEHRLATCEALMMLTSLEHASHDWAMALSEPGGEFQLCGHIGWGEPYTTDLQSPLLEFATQAQQWRDIVARGAQQDVVEHEVFSPDVLA
ncbi:type III secretion system chaperone [Variovorax soli]|uniref:Tir chaperone protein (CesT) family protein n=1 Tax=Variovorax soli TaxID=376815 RepID=A0ABU1NGZ7_9BURK|nr:type III secretion system chaperone [Variovorax soli]MDR6537723.1 hypothetical protein [Variovorax soli]